MKYQQPNHYIIGRDRHDMFSDEDIGNEIVQSSDEEEIEDVESNMRSLKKDNIKHNDDEPEQEESDEEEQDEQLPMTSLEDSKPSVEHKLPELIPDEVFKQKL